jgi:hypothetical protein
MQEHSHQKPIVKIFKESKNELATLVHKVQRLQQLNQYLANILDSQLSKHCQIANFENEVLTLVTDSADWATQIRYKIPDLIEQLKDTPAFQDLKTIRCIISPVSEDR